MSKTLLVTGASKGIGLETVRRFVAGDDPPAKAILVARPSAEYSEALKELASVSSSTEIVSYELDLADRDAVLDLVRTIASDHGNVDLLVNNAGYTKPVPIQQIDFADFERTMAVNVYAPFTFVQELLHQGNHFELIVNIASTAGINGRSGWLTYSASKAAVINMSEVMREELAIYGTRVVCISPGRTATALRRVLAPDEDPSTIMQPGDVATVIEMLASPVGRFVDSANLVVRQ
ncbi:SDR family NAD(P)-dependent oxidoreductase [Cellulomonas sp. PhB143]|uniref:SDR family NAD(P)-dependent oxidoreductase n=1 Tax=Cellulomonas sp. PhB143 TaxID=2485186 RepID=UPI000F48722C|nr:SDR family oxidoreductase [Cellulomonas sp. PhB143]ROS78554.1 3-oxoacyl-[acyl-carrier protein] reductase [Cellulomonas sp. PhB143]